MTTQELHINLDVLLQKSNSNWNKNFLPQEKDFFINREILKIIKQRLNPLSNNKRLNIFDIIKRTQDLNIKLDTVVLPIESYNEKEDIVYLPFNYLYYISSETNSLPVCNKEVLNIVTNQTYFKYIDAFTDLTEEIIIQIIFNGNTIELFNTNNLPFDYLPQDGIQDYRKKFILNNAILNSVLRNIPKEIEITFDKVTNKFVFKSKSIFSLILNGNLVNTVTTSSNVYNIETKLVSDVRISSEEFKSNINKSCLSGSKDESVVGYLRGSFILFPKTSNVVKSLLTLTYISKPLKIDLLLDYNSDLSNELLEEVISNVAESMKAVIASDTYEKYKQDNLLIE
jgi:hypothetical protein